MVTVVTNGSVSNRLNIVLLSEGYTTNQLGAFRSDATNAIDEIATIPHQRIPESLRAFGGELLLCTSLQ